MPTVTSNTVSTTVTSTSGSYIRSWLMNGYYSNTNTSTRLSTDYLGGESSVRPDTGSTSGGKTWSAYTSSGDIIDLNAAFGGGTKTYCAGYAHVYVYSPSTQSVRLWLGSDNGIKAWLNGSVVETVDTGRGLTVDQDKLTVTLNSGWNRLLVKVSQYGGNWQLTARFCDGSGNPISGLQYQTNAPATSDTSKSPASYIRNWLTNGYYPNTNTSTRLSTDYLGGESGVKPDTGSTSGGKTWTVYASSTDIIDLNAAFGGGIKTYSAGYAHVYVYSPSTQSVRLWLGSDNGVKVWLNGALVETVDTGRGLTMDQDKLTVTLNSGWNRLLAKVSQYGGNWQLAARFCDGSGNAISGLQYQTDAPVSTLAALALDVTPPDVQNVNVTVTDTTATVTWTTDEESTSTVVYGLTADMDQEQTDSAMATDHSVTLTGLTPGTTYVLKVGSADASGNVTWDGNYTFTTNP